MIIESDLSFYIDSLASWSGFDHSGAFLFSQLQNLIP